jgi:hypothetical protein
MIIADEIIPLVELLGSFHEKKQIETNKDDQQGWEKSFNL